MLALRRDAGCSVKPWLHVPGCAVVGCKGDGVWLNPDEERVYCEGHSREYLMAEDRADLGDEYQRERDAEDDDYARDCA